MLHVLRQPNVLFGNFISGLKVVDSINKPIRLFCDNAIVVRFVENQNVTTSNKHIEIKYYYVLNKREEGRLRFHTFLLTT